MPVLDSSVPERSLAQRRLALDSANHIRSYRAGLKTRVKAGETRAVDVLRDPAPEVETMRVYALVLAVPKVGRVKADRILRRHAVSPSKTVGGLTVRQRDELVTALTPYSVRYARRIEA